MDWVAKQGVQINQQVLQFDAEMVGPGDTVIGNLPISLIATLNAKGADYLHLEMSVPFEYRGVELSVEQMEGFGAKLVPYHAKRL